VTLSGFRRSWPRATEFSVPYFGYARQERRSAEAEPRSAQVASRVLSTVGIDHLVTLDLRAPGLESAFSIPVANSRPNRALLPRIGAWGLCRLTVVSPNAGALHRAQHYATVLEAELAAIAKSRPQIDKPEPLQVLGDVRDRTCLLVDDIASTGSTLTGAAEAILNAGASEVHAAFAHPVMATGALVRFASSPIKRLVTTDSIPPPTHPRIQIVGIGPMLAEAVRELLPV